MTRNFNQSQKKFIWSRQNNRCGNCGKNLLEEVNMEYHHILNYKDGGASIVENAVLLCDKCHLHVHNYNFKKSILIYREQFMYANWEKNSEYKSRKKGREVDRTKATLDKFDQQYEREKMSSSYDEQLRMLENFDEDLHTLKSKLQELRSNYKKQIDKMKHEGFFEDYIKTLQQKYQEFSIRIDQVDELIKKNQVEIKLQQEALEELKYVAGDDY